MKYNEEVMDFMEVKNFCEENLYNEQFNEVLANIICNEFESDEEPYESKYTYTIRKYINSSSEIREAMDDVAIGMTGWSLNTLLKEAMKQMQETSEGDND